MFTPLITGLERYRRLSENVQAVGIIQETQKKTKYSYASPCKKKKFYFMFSNLHVEQLLCPHGFRVKRRFWLFPINENITIRSPNRPLKRDSPGNNTVTPSLKYVVYRPRIENTSFGTTRRIVINVTRPQQELTIIRRCTSLNTRRSFSGPAWRTRRLRGHISSA